MDLPTENLWLGPGSEKLQETKLISRAVADFSHGDGCL